MSGAVKRTEYVLYHMGAHFGYAPALILKVHPVLKGDDEPRVNITIFIDGGNTPVLQKQYVEYGFDTGQWIRIDEEPGTETEKQASAKSGKKAAKA